MDYSAKLKSFHDQQKKKQPYNAKVTEMRNVTFNRPIARAIDKNDCSNCGKLKGHALFINRLLAATRELTHGSSTFDVGIAISFVVAVVVVVVHL